jgi:phosphoadenosine phosphosulfate reductase
MGMKHSDGERLFDDHDALEWRAIELLQDNCPPEGYYVTFSGGKDSTVCLDLVKRSGCTFDAHYNVTGVDPPEIVQFIRDKHPEVIFERPLKTMWQLIEENGMPPLRQMRYCCRWLKERTAENRVTVTGVRAEESQSRSLRGAEVKTNERKKKYVCPIFTWSSHDIWRHIEIHALSYCELYDKGWSRIGCIGCPFNSQRKTQLALYPGIAHAYRNACRKAFAHRIEQGKPTRWRDGDEMYSWWIGETSLPPELRGEELFVDEDDTP